jgi:hypothetical protein
MECYKGVLESLQCARIPYAIAGAFALHRHTGIWRTTKDLDIVLEAGSIPTALKQLEERGFKTHIEDPVWLAKATRGEYFVDFITALGNAVLLVDAQWLARSTPDEIFGVPCHVLAAEEVIASKVFISRRERFDGADVAHLIRAQGQSLDWDRIQYLLAPHWEMLLWSLVFFAYIYPAHVNLVPHQVWNGLISRLAKQIQHPSKDSPFRGTLIDPNMFAIDVAEWGERNLYREYCDQHPFLLQAVESTRRREE